MAVCTVSPIVAVDEIDLEEAAKEVEQWQKARVNINMHYPHSDLYLYTTRLERINMDEERIRDITSGNGFIITSSKPIKEEIKDPNGILSYKYGRTLNDLHPYSDRYRCKCGTLRSTFNQNQICKICNHPVVFVDDNFSFFGWMVLKDPYWYIHPSLFMSLSSFIGPEEFENIIRIQVKKDEDGNDVEIKRPKKEPFFGIGMMEFHDRFDEIMDYYYQTKCRTKSKLDRYEDIMRDRDKVFAQSFPVFTTLLRPWKVEAGEFHYEGTNAIFKILSTIACNINDDTLVMKRNHKSKNELLFDFQMKIKELFNEINSILSGKKGSVRQLFGGRFNFTARSVIAPDRSLHIDEVRLSYQCLVGLLQQRIINVLVKAFSMQYNEAYIFLDSNRRNRNPIIEEIINSIIRSNKRGLPVLINRNPTLVYGGILQMYCVGICNGYTMTVPLQILKGLAADFDGDTLNILSIINHEFLRAAEKVFNPANAMIISRNDGFFNNDYNNQRDTLINTNTSVQLGRDNYTDEDKERIGRCKAKITLYYNELSNKAVT